MLTQWFTPLTLAQIERLLTLLGEDQAARDVACQYGKLPAAMQAEADGDRALVMVLTQAKTAIARHNARKGRFDAAFKRT